MIDSKTVRAGICLFSLITLLMTSTSTFCANLQHYPFLTKLQGYSAIYLLKSRTPGAVVLVDSPKTGLVEFALGYASLKGKGVPMSLSHNFRVASISKTFLTVMILKQVQLGKIQLEAKMSQYLPATIDIHDIPNGEMVTISQLLNMTSGIPEYYDEDVDALLIKKPYKHWRPEDVIKRVSQMKASFKPGTQYEYSNTNYVLLALILESVSKKSLTENFNTLIVEPLKLKQTFVDDFSVENITLNTRGYSSEHELKDMTDINDGLGTGDAFVVTTASDLHRFLKALFIDKTLLPAKYLNKMLKANIDSQYGMGVEIDKGLKGTGRVYYHNGLVNGFQCQYFYVPKYNMLMIILTNDMDTEMIEPLFSRMIQYYRKI